MSSNQKIKNKEFDLFKLHKKIDKHPRSWICIKGNGIKEIVNEIEKRITKEKDLCREKISKILSKKLNCSFTSFKKILRGETAYFPIPFIQGIIRLCKDDSYLEKIDSKIEFLKVNSAISNEVSAIKNLNGDLAKIIGAFMADGSLTVTFMLASENKINLNSLKIILKNNNINYNKWYSKSRDEYSLGLTINKENHNLINKIINSLDKKVKIQSHYNLEITDEHKSNLECFRKWILNYFNIQPNSFKEKKAAWRLVYSNKIMARYFMTFLDVIPGPKTHIAFEPQIIKNSNLEIRKLFARGVLMFDGSFISAGKLCFSTKSRHLFESIKDILKKDGLDIGTKRSREEYTIYTYERASKEKILFYFEKETHKWFRVKDFLETKNQSIEELIKRYKIYTINKVTFEKLYNLIKDVKSCDLEFLSNYFNCSKHIIKAYLIILRSSKLIKFSKHPDLIKKEFVKNSTKILLKEDTHSFIFSKIKEKFGTYMNFCKQIHIHKSRISAWKLRKNKIELSVLKKICSLCNIDFSVVLNNIEETDRKIIEII